ncbi:MAG TPA: hypothetical protein VM597_39720 [Gemmataceae bacterium]|nr:hypothetical protein [Gemmataceae bacterium]
MLLFDIHGNWNKFCDKSVQPNTWKPLPCPQSEATIRDVLDQMAGLDGLAKDVYDGYKAETASVSTGIHPDNPAKIKSVASSADDPTIHFSIYTKPGSKKHHVYVTGPVMGKYTYVRTTCPG